MTWFGWSQIAIFAVLVTAVVKPLGGYIARLVAGTDSVSSWVAPFERGIISFRAEFFNDENGQRTGVKTRYVDVGLGWQHWFSPHV
jgi:K+-transporting ATPase A subunit